MVDPLPPDFPSDLKLVPGLPNPYFAHRAAYRVTHAGNVVTVLEIVTAEEQERGRFAAPTRGRAYGGGPQNLPEPEYDLNLARERYGPFGAPQEAPTPEDLTRGTFQQARPISEWRAIGVIPYGSVSAFRTWSSRVTAPGRIYVGAAYAIWNGYLTVRPGGELVSGSLIPSSALIPYRTLRSRTFSSSPFRVENRPGSSPVSVPTILALLYAAGQSAVGATTRIPNALTRYGWSICGHIRTSNVATYCPPVGAETRKTVIELPPPSPGAYFIPRPSVRGQYTLTGGKARRVPEAAPSRPPPPSGRQLKLSDVIPFDPVGDWAPKYP